MKGGEEDRSRGGWGRRGGEVNRRRGGEVEWRRAEEEEGRS